MKATFLGHGLDSKNKFNVGKQLAVSFDSSNYDTFNGFVAFAAVSGVSAILKNLKKAKGNYNQLRFFIGVDNKGTSKEALDLLLKENIETYIYHDKRDYVTYHPKLFVFEGSKHTRIIIGSSNLTSSGIKSNIEASIQLDFRSQTDSQGKKILDEIKEYNSDLLNLKSNKIKLLTSDLINDLLERGLLYRQFGANRNPKETKPNDGENDETVDLTDFDINTGFNQEYDDTLPRTKKINFTKNDYEKFDELIERYLTYKKDERNSGVVYKHTDDRELFNWYRKMTDLFNQDLLPLEIFERLMAVDFPFGDGKERSRLFKWDEDFEKLVEYRNKIMPNSKFTHVPQFKDKLNPYYHLGIWCAAQKQRRKGNYTPKWTEYEEEKMNSIYFLWDASINGGRPKDDEWVDNLAELEEFYDIPTNYKTVPSQKTKVGKWLNDQITLKVVGSRGKVKRFLSPIREEMLGELLFRNGVEWEWEKQKHRESIEEAINAWKIISNFDTIPKRSDISENELNEIKIHREKVTQLRHRSKKWHNEKNKWKLEMLDKTGFPYPKMNE